jgi:hypothetical protein
MVGVGVKEFAPSALLYPTWTGRRAIYDFQMMSARKSLAGVAVAVSMTTASWAAQRTVLRALPAWGPVHVGVGVMLVELKHDAVDRERSAVCLCICE